MGVRCVCKYGLNTSAASSFQKVLPAFNITSSYLGLTESDNEARAEAEIDQSPSQYMQHGFPYYCDFVPSYFETERQHTVLLCESGERQPVRATTMRKKPSLFSGCPASLALQEFSGNSAPK
eukprot:5889330-Amphidinium_carterae.1